MKNERTMCLLTQIMNLKDEITSVLNSKQPFGILLWLVKDTGERWSVLCQWQQHFYFLGLLPL